MLVKSKKILGHGLGLHGLTRSIKGVVQEDDGPTIEQIGSQAIQGESVLHSRYLHGQRAVWMEAPRDVGW